MTFRALWNRAPAAWTLPILAGGAVFGWSYRRLSGYLADDTFISLRYAQHLAEGWGLVYNHGERVEGYTNFLWTVMLAAPFALHLPIVPFLKILNGLLALAAAWATWRLGRAAGLPPALAWLPVVLFLVSPATMVSAAEGLETMLFTTLLALSIALYLGEGPETRIPWSAVALSALALSRPDGALFAPLLFVAALIGGRGTRYAMRFAACFTVLFGGYFACRAFYYGDLLPNTFYAKGAGTIGLLKSGWLKLVQFAHDCGGWAWLAAIPSLVARRTRATSALLAGVVLLRGAFHVWSGGPWMGQHRFLVPILPFLLVLTVCGIATWPSRWGRRLALVAAAGLLLAPGWAAYADTEARLIGYGDGLRRAHGAFGAAVGAYTKPDAVIAMDDAGLGPLMADRTTIDMLGLNDRHIAHLPGPYGKFDIAYVLARRPDLIVLLSRVPDPRWDSDYLIGYHGPLRRSTGFQSHYRFCRSFMFMSDYYLLVFRRDDSSAVPEDFCTRPLTEPTPPRQ